MIVKLLTEHHLEFLSLKGGCRGSFESTLVKKSNCWKSRAAANLMIEELAIMSCHVEPCGLPHLLTQEILVEFSYLHNL